MSLDGKKIASVSGITLGGLALLDSQFSYKWITFANQATSNAFLILCLAIISFGLCLMNKTWAKRLISFVIILAVFIVAIYLTGAFGLVLDASNGATVVAQNPYFGFNVFMLSGAEPSDYLASAETFASIVNTLISIIPAIIFVVSVIQIETAGTDGMMDALFTVFIILAIMLAFGYLGSLIGFHVFGENVISPFGIYGGTGWFATA